LQVDYLHSIFEVFAIPNHQVALIRQEGKRAIGQLCPLEQSLDRT